MAATEWLLPAPMDRPWIGEPVWVREESRLLSGEKMMAGGFLGPATVAPLVVTIPEVPAPAALGALVALRAHTGFKLETGFAVALTPLAPRSTAYWRLNSGRSDLAPEYEHR